MVVFPAPFSNLLWLHVNYCEVQYLNIIIQHLKHLYLQERLKEMERVEELRAREEREMIEEKMERVREAERQRDEPLDDSQMVDQIFDFLPLDSASETQAPPLRFQVKWLFAVFLYIFLMQDKTALYYLCTGNMFSNYDYITAFSKMFRYVKWSQWFLFAAH